MSEPKRLHPVTIIIGMIKSIREVIIPILIYYFVFSAGGKMEGEQIWVKIGPFIVIGFFIIYAILINIIRWYRYTYWLEDMELRIEHGLFVKKKRYIPFERIQSFDFSEGIFHRPFSLVKVKVETAGGKLEEAEAEMSAIKKEEALAIRSLILEVKRKNVISEELEESVETGETTLLYKITVKQLLFFASTSGSVGVVVSAVIAFIAQFDELIPFDKIFKEMEHIVRAGYLIFVILIFIGLILAWIVSVFMTYFKYNDFTLRKVKDDIVVTRGLLEKRTTTIPIRRVQAIKIIESPLRQPFGYASVLVEYAGASLTDESSEGLLMPVVKKNRVATILREVFPDYNLEVEMIKTPIRAKRRFYFIKMIFMAAIALGLSIWLWPYGLTSLLLVGGAWILGMLQYRSAGWKIVGNQLVLRYRDLLQQHTVFMKKNRMQSFGVSANWFQRRAKLGSISTAVMSGGLANFTVKHLDIEDAKSIYEWYQPQKKNIKSADIHHALDKIKDQE